MPCARGCCDTEKEHYQSLTFSAPSPKSEAEKQFAKDREAYRRLRQNGLQPPRIDGCAVLEKHATTRAEIETGAVIWKRSEIRAAHSIGTSRSD